MCFSPEASFAVAAVLMPAGLYCLHSASTKDRRFLALSLIPLLFSIQQFAEGLVWVALESDNMPLARGAALLFLFFALFIWPFWVPFSVAFIEPRTGTKQFFSAVAMLALVSGWALYAPLLLNFGKWLTIRVVHHSIQYDFRVLAAFEAVGGAFWQLLYLGSICCPLFVSFTGPFRLFAISLAISAVISHFMYRYAFESVWCFFAAALSMQLCLAFHELRTPEGGPRPCPVAPSP
jgi:Family of unknown function (DUF6629)